MVEGNNRNVVVVVEENNRKVVVVVEEEEKNYRVYGLQPKINTIGYLTKTEKESPAPPQQGFFLLGHARPLNKQCAWRLTTGSAFIRIAHLKGIIAISLLVGLGECARDLKKCVVCKKNSNMVLTKAN